jgi:hypothetical protein
MILKEMYQYSNFLSTTLSNCYVLLYDEELRIKGQEFHYPSRVNPEAEDKVVDLNKHKYPFTIEEVLSLCEDLLAEYCLTTKTIELAKRQMAFSVDTAITNNRKTQHFLSVLDDVIAKTKDEVREQKATGYKFDINGEQKPYIYEVEVKKERAFDVANFKALSRKLHKECDETSSLIDQVTCSSNFEFTPKFCIHDSIEDILLARKA